MNIIKEIDEKQITAINNFNMVDYILLDIKSYREFVDTYNEGIRGWMNVEKVEDVPCMVFGCGELQVVIIDIDKRIVEVGCKLKSLRSSYKELAKS